MVCSGAPLPPVSRRTLLVGAAATALLAACGGDGGVATPDGSANTDGTYVLVQRFPQDTQTPGRIRMPISLADATGTLLTDGPAELGAQVVDIDGSPVGGRITAVRRDIEPAPYWSFRVDIADPGVYYLVVDGGPAAGAAFQVMEPGTVTITGPGERLAPFDTPTVADGRGVDPVCTRQPDPCPFHEHTLTEALAAGTPVVYLIGTPAFCSTGTCAPALESAITLSARYGDAISVVHAEVYTDDTAVDPTPAVTAANLHFEPVVWVTDADGVVVERLDAIWNDTELAEAIDAALG